MKQISVWYIIPFLMLFGCSDPKKPNAKPIVLGDSNLIVTEKDTQFLMNFTEDISPSPASKKANQIQKMMVQVDSLNTAKKLNEEQSTRSVSGFAVTFSECTVTLGGILCHALNNTQNERTENSVSYLLDQGQFLENTLKVEGLSQIQMEQRLTVKLAVEAEGESYILNDLGKFQTSWYPLAGKEQVFVSVSANSLQFKEVGQNEIKNALDRELRKKRKSIQEIQAWMNRIKLTRTITDAPCKLVAVSTQWKLVGVKDGKSVRKLIQLDVP